MGAEARDLEVQVQALNDLIDFVCDYAKLDRRRMENSLKHRQSLTK
jgi:hypothetical protein